jgi:hypothetical protein
MMTVILNYCASQQQYSWDCDLWHNRHSDLKIRVLIGATIAVSLAEFFQSRPLLGYGWRSPMKPFRVLANGFLMSYPLYKEHYYLGLFFYPWFLASSFLFSAPSILLRDRWNLRWEVLPIFIKNTKISVRLYQLRRHSQPHPCINILEREVVIKAVEQSSKQ